MATTGRLNYFLIIKLVVPCLANVYPNYWTILRYFFLLFELLGGIEQVRHTDRPRDPSSDVLSSSTSVMVLTETDLPNLFLLLCSAIPMSVSVIKFRGRKG